MNSMIGLFNTKYDKTDEAGITADKATCDAILYEELKMGNSPTINILDLNTIYLHL